MYGNEMASNGTISVLSFKYIDLLI